MQQIMIETLAGEETGCSHVLGVDLSGIEGRERLVEHVDRYLRLYLQSFPPLKACHVRLGPATYGLDAAAVSRAGLDAMRADLASRLFTEDESWRVRLETRPVESESEYELPGQRAGSDAGTGEALGRHGSAGEEIDIASELSDFRQDLRTIADSLTGHEALRESVESFRAELGEISEAFSERVTHAAHAIENAAQRVEASAAMIPDPDRLELVLTRNEASAAILERGVRQSLSLLLQAVEAMSERGAVARRDRLTHEDSGAGTNAAA